MRQTGQGINPASGKEEGVVCRGGGYDLRRNCRRDELSAGQCREWMARLINEKYVRTERDRRGLRIFVCNPKKFRVSEVQRSKPIVSAGSPAGSVSEVQHSKHIHAIENSGTSEMLLQNDPTKLLKNNNTTPLAKGARLTCSLYEKDSGRENHTSGDEPERGRRKAKTPVEARKELEAEVPGQWKQFRKGGSNCMTLTRKDDAGARA